MSKGLAMLYDGGAGGPIGLFLLALAVGALIGFILRQRLSDLCDLV
jgi:hypothetical protein